jgi:predicted small secreted protein
MDQYFDALQKAHTREGILGSVNETKEDFLEKGKKAQIGEIRTWKGVKFQKQPNGGWTPVKTDKKKGHYEEFVDSDTGEVVKVWREEASSKESSFEEQETGLTYQEKIKLDNEARKEFTAIESEFKSALENLKDKYDERKQLEIDQEQEVGSLYVAGKDAEAEELAQKYGEKFNSIDDEIGMLNSKIDGLKPKYIQARQEYNKKADEIWN